MKSIERFVISLCVAVACIFVMGYLMNRSDPILDPRAPLNIPFTLIALTVVAITLLISATVICMALRDRRAAGLNLIALTFLWFIIWFGPYHGDNIRDFLAKDDLGTDIEMFAVILTPVVVGAYLVYSSTKRK